MSSGLIGIVDFWPGQRDVEGIPSYRSNESSVHTVRNQGCCCMLLARDYDIYTLMPGKQIDIPTGTIVTIPDHQRRPLPEGRV